MGRCLWFESAKGVFVPLGALRSPPVYNPFETGYLSLRTADMYVTEDKYANSNEVCSFLRSMMSSSRFSNAATCIGTNGHRNIGRRREVASRKSRLTMRIGSSAREIHMGRMCTPKGSAFVVQFRQICNDSGNVSQSIDCVQQPVIWYLGSNSASKHSRVTMVYRLYDRMQVQRIVEVIDLVVGCITRKIGDDRSSSLAG
ncbi:hypothetical protein F5Y18DRAFT_305866 [Xylariaceae sp. FL1019]|nr:hypothetical protein F5Y18DRAFT_305866 [Xylariaceae sp. FL1019]